MNCPSCGQGLTGESLGDLTVDVCRSGCGGVWFDHKELQRVDEPHETSIDALPRSSPAGGERSRFRCPQCDDTVMMRRWFSVRRSVEVDECPLCGGFWLDAGELQAIRQEFPTEEERRAAARQAGAALAAELDASVAQSRFRHGEFQRLCRLLGTRRPWPFFWW